MEKQSNSFLSKVKAAFKSPRFVVEFVAWVLATVILIAAILYYALIKDVIVTVYKVGDKCPEFILDTYKSDNDAQSFSTFGINKVTVINFWYTTCDPCKDELPYFEKVYEEYGEEIDMFVVHSSTLYGPVQEFLDTEVDENGRAWNSYKLVWAQDTSETRAYMMLGGKGAFPHTVVVNARGYITAVNPGTTTENDLRMYIQNALAQ